MWPGRQLYAVFGNSLDNRIWEAGVVPAGGRYAPESAELPAALQYRIEKGSEYLGGDSNRERYMGHVGLTLTERRGFRGDGESYDIADGTRTLLTSTRRSLDTEGDIKVESGNKRLAVGRNEIVAARHAGYNGSFKNDAAFFEELAKLESELLKST